MFIKEPNHILRLADSDDGLTDDGTHYLFRMHRETVQSYMDKVALQPSDKAYSEASEFLTKITGVYLSGDVVKRILELYPYVRISLAEEGGAGSTHIRDDLSFVVAHFFLGARWPNFGDKIDVTRFIAILQSEAKALGFGKNC
jgi:hypothetical protein